MLSVIHVQERGSISQLRAPELQLSVSLNYAEIQWMTFFFTPSLTRIRADGHTLFLSIAKAKKGARNVFFIPTELVMSAQGDVQKSQRE